MDVKSKKKQLYSFRMQKLWKQIWRCRALYIMILPAVTTLFIFHYIPLYGVQIAFKDFRASLGIWNSEWVGFKHFDNFFNYPYFERILWNTLWISIVSLCTFPAPIIFTLMLNEMRNQKVKKVCQMITYAPHFVSTVVVCSMVTMFLNRNGLINNVIVALGGNAQDFMSIPSAFAPIYALSGVWTGLGWGTIIYLAALAGVSPELIEAAKIDGANRMQVIWHINLPHLKPTIITLFIMNMGSLLSVGFEKTFLLQNALNKEASSVISTYVYEIGIINQQFSYSSAIGLFNNIVNFIMLMTANYIAKKVAKTGLW